MPSRSRSPWAGKQGTRDGDQLALARREAGAALADDVLEPVIEPRSYPVDAHGGGGGAHLFVRGIGFGEADVVGDRAAEQEGVLEHDAELAPVADELDVPEVGAVDADGSLVRVVEAGDQLRRRRLAAARFADERDAAARRH